jgi:uridine kinase
MIVKNLQGKEIYFFFEKKDKRVAVIAQDSFYKTLNITQQIFAAKSEYNFGSFFEIFNFFRPSRCI